MPGSDSPTFFWWYWGLTLAKQELYHLSHASSSLILKTKLHAIFLGIILKLKINLGLTYL
jgi:hypothetical protein